MSDALDRSQDVPWDLRPPSPGFRATPVAPGLQRLAQQIPRPAGPVQPQAQPDQQQPPIDPGVYRGGPITVPPLPNWQGTIRPTLTSLPQDPQAADRDWLRQNAGRFGGFQDLDSIYRAAGEYYGLDWRVLKGIAQVESSQNINVADSSAGAQGLMQFIPKTAAQYGVDVRNPFSSVFGAAHYMKDLLRKHNGNMSAALQEYNGASGDPTFHYARSVETAMGNKSLAQPMPRQPDQWGRPDAAWTAPNAPPGMMPTHNDLPNIMAGALALFPLTALASRLPLGLGLAAYGAMSQARTNGQLLDFKMHAAQWEQAMREHQDKEQLEGQAVGDAFLEFDKSKDPEGLKHALMDIAGRFQDEQLFRMAQAEQFDQAYKINERRDQLNQPLMKLQAQRQQQQEIADMVAAMDQQWLAANPDKDQNSPEFRIAHGQHIGEATREIGGKEKPAREETPAARKTREDLKALDDAVEADVADYKRDHPDASDGELAQVRQSARAAREHPRTGGTESLEAPKEYQPVDRDGKPVGQPLMLRTKRNEAGYFDPDSGERYHPPEGTTLRPVTKGEDRESLDVPKQYELVDKDGNVHGNPVMLRTKRNAPGYYDPDTGERYHPPEGMSLKPITPTTAGGGRTGAQVERQIIGGKEVISDLQNIKTLRVGTTTGTLGSFVPKTTFLGALAGDLSRKITSDDSKLMRASLASLGRELSTLMSPVYGGKWAAESLEPLIPMEGDGIGISLFKIARIAQSADNALEVVEKMPTLNTEQRRQVSEFRNELKAAIPWTPAAAQEFVYRGKKHETFGQFVEREHIGTSAAPTNLPQPTTQQEYDALPSGSRYKDDEGNIRTKR